MVEQKQDAMRVDWRQSVSWLSLFRGFRLALDVKKMILGFVAIVATYGGFLVLREVWLLLSATPPPAHRLPEVTGHLLATIQQVPSAVLYGSSGMETLCRQWGHFSDLLIKTVEWFPGFCVVFGLLMLIIWSYFGGAISRMAAVQFSRDERISLTEGLSFTGKKYVSLFFAPLIPFLAIIFVSIFSGLVGLLAAVPYFGEWFAGIFWPLPLIVGFILTLIAVGGIFGMPLMHPTIGAEGSDAFDAISRSFSYVYSRPWRAVFYAVLAIIYGVIVFAFVSIFTGLLLAGSRFCVAFIGGTIFPGIGVGDKIYNLWPRELGVWNWNFSGGEVEAARMAAADLTGSETAAAYVLRFWVWLVYGLVWGFAVSYAYSGLTIIYFLLRKNVDNTEFDEVYLEEEEEEAFEEFGEGQPAFGEEEKPVAEDTTEQQTPEAGEEPTDEGEGGGDESEPSGDEDEDKES